MLGASEATSLRELNGAVGHSGRPGPVPFWGGGRLGPGISSLTGGKLKVLGLGCLLLIRSLYSSRIFHFYQKGDKVTLLGFSVVETK